MPVTEQWTNPDVLHWARERLNLTVDRVIEESKKLAKRHFAQISAEDLTAWEAGTGEPELAQLETLAEIYACPVGWFFLRSRPKEELRVSFRGLAKPREQLGSLSQRTLRRFMEQAQWTVETLRKTAQPWQVGIRPAQVSPSILNPDQLAAQYRQRFGWTIEQRRRFAGKYKEAFGWWRRAIESQGVFCFEMPLDPAETRGAALWLEDYPFILVNHQDNEAAAGRIFTLLHEFAHLISAGEGVVCDFHGSRHAHNPEPFANRFAARVLVTPDELRQRLREVGEDRQRTDWPDSLLDKLRNPFCASRDVVAILLQELRLAPADFYERKRQRWASQKRFARSRTRPTRNEQKLQEVGYSLANLLARSAARPAFSWLDAASILGMKVEKTEAFLKWAHTHAK
ncbi:MAG: ImmA/IrrE family metallo-endopeptidase [Verrucomicrobiota bacterium]|nr:ImmA/IrrE family metallo-endopeptidase [Verrucomicrobiota bacterium]